MRVVPSATRCQRVLQPALYIIMSISGRPLDEARAENGRMHAYAIERSEATYGPQCCDAKVAADDYTWDSYSFPGTSARSAIGIDANALQGFQQDELARVSTVPLVSREECAAVIAEAEAVAAWETSGQIAHYARRAGSLTPVSDLPRTLEWLRDDLFLANRLFPAIQRALPSLEDASLRLSDARLVKYNASAGQTELGMHRDGPLVTATVALNPPTDYEGGGTLIEALLHRSTQQADNGQTITAPTPASSQASTAQSTGGRIADGSRSLVVDAGHVILHPGAVRHGGCRILSGVRYVLVCFIFDANVRACATQHGEPPRSCVHAPTPPLSADPPS